ncbi:hypothetical protein BDZ94DRAFT_1246809 [Collybia nuda]|uniref:Uncharacterized protein n=1 Tax=Collybia nuda TaxID=64659 RepID=A0A9P5YGD1_9AGAR|nr:hypothetical protein BDZ94DRAFT_1246809 [Collybia nuda]
MIGNTAVTLKGTTPPVFPQEIFDSIIDYLRTNSPALRSASLVCNAFATSCRRIAFYKITIDADTFKTLPKLIRQAPEIPTFVRELHIVGGHDDLFSELSLPPLLKEFKAIQRLRWKIFQHHSFSEWKWMPLEQREAFSALISQPTLTHLDLSGIVMLPIAELYSLNRGLHYLGLNNITIDTSPKQHLKGSTLGENLPQIRLEHAGLAFLQDETVEVLLSEQSPFDFTGLESCAVVEVGPAGNLVLQACQKSLQHYGHVFWRWIGPQTYTATLQRDIAAIGNLRSLTFLPVYSYKGMPTTKPMLDVLEAVCHSPSCALENVTIIIWTEHFRPPYKNIEIWKAIDLALSLPASLKKVTYIAPVHGRSGFSLEALQRGVRDIFPCIWKSGKAHLEIHSDNKGSEMNYWTIDFSVLSSFDRYSLHV